MSLRPLSLLLKDSYQWFRRAFTTTKHFRRATSPFIPRPAFPLHPPPLVTACQPLHLCRFLLSFLSRRLQIQLIRLSTRLAPHKCDLDDARSDCSVPPRHLDHPVNVVVPSAKHSYRIAFARLSVYLVVHHRSLKLLLAPTNQQRETCSSPTLTNSAFAHRLFQTHSYKSTNDESRCFVLSMPPYRINCGFISLVYLSLSSHYPSIPPFVAAYLSPSRSRVFVEFSSRSVKCSELSCTRLDPPPHSSNAAATDVGVPSP
ncbi:hypothetical protein R3P38DRAFT_3122754 [Favolaschia claudopus]|uniref:Uncharacterized protein n=1 Tax=Favolaschia claudopus TaxID=2862362 RepID=A0AAV9ZC12_9AGAR